MPLSTGFRILYNAAPGVTRMKANADFRPAVLPAFAANEFHMSSTAKRMIIFWQTLVFIELVKLKRILQQLCLLKPHMHKTFCFAIYMVYNFGAVVPFLRVMKYHDQQQRTQSSNLTILGRKCFM